MEVSCINADTLFNCLMCNISVIDTANNTKFGMWTPTGRRKHHIVSQRNPLTHLGVNSVSHESLQTVVYILPVGQCKKNVTYVSDVMPRQ